MSGFAVGVLVPALVAWIAVRRDTIAWRRRLAGLCVRCAYDVRATPGRCPECGAVPA